MKTKNSKLAIVVATAFSILSTSAIYAVDDDFSGLPGGTPVPSATGISSITTYGGPGPAGTPVGGIDFPYGLANSVSGNYPTSEYLTFNFTAPSLVTQFSLNEYGYNPGANYQAYNSANVLVGTGSLSAYGSGGTDVVDVANVSTLVFDNFYGSFGESWEFVVSDIQFNPSASAPDSGSSMLLMSLGLGGIAAVRRWFGKV